MITTQEPKEFLQLQEEFFANAKEKNLSKNLTNYVWNVLICTQRGYGFNKSHTLAYSIIGLQELNLCYKYSPIYWQTANLIVDSGAVDENAGDSTNYGKMAIAIAAVQKENGLNVAKKAEDNDQSHPIKVIDKNTLEIVGIYGSLRECARCIENTTLSNISKVYQLENYKPRTKKFIYKAISTDEFNSYPKNLISKHLIENHKDSKNPKIFRMTNKKLKYDSIMDNQVTASKICGIQQAQISHYLLEGDTSSHNGWSFELIGQTTRKESSAYQNHLDTIDSITIQNINDNRIMEFKSGKELKDYFGLKGHDLIHYIKTNQILMNEWRIINKIEKTCVQNVS